LAAPSFFLCRQLKVNKVEDVLISQFLLCGTSIGANAHETQYAQGTKDFISKLEKLYIDKKGRKLRPFLFSA